MARTNLGRVVPLHKGDYSATIEYELNDIVSYNGSTYWHFTHEKTTGILPTETSVWKLVIDMADAEQYIARAETAALQSEGYADDAQNAKTDAETAKANAETAKQGAVSAKQDALVYEENARSYMTAAQTAKGQAESARDLAIQAKTDAVDAKQGAESAKDTAVSAKNDAVSAKTAAETAKTAAQTASTHYPKISDANRHWLVWDALSAAYVDTGIIAEGKDGADGKDGKNGTNGTDGKNGTDGVSPTVATQAITDGTKVTITDKDGAHEFNVMNGTNGTNGTDGITPTIGANGNWYLGDADTGKPSRGATGAAGATGPAGKSAYASAQDGGFTGTEAQFNKGLSVMGQVDGVEDTDALGIDTTVTQNSGNLITSGAVYTFAKATSSQVTPLFAQSVDELNVSGDTTKLYVLPDGYIYAYINGIWTNTQQAFTSFDMLNKLKDACVDEVSVAGTNYNLFKMSEVTYFSRLQDNSADILTKDTLTAQIVSGWIPVEYNKFYTASILAGGARATVYGGSSILNRVNVKKVDGSIAYNQRAALTTGGATHLSSTIHINSSDIVAVQLNIYVEKGDISTPDKLAVYEPMFVGGDTFENAHSNALSLAYIGGDEVPPPKIEYSLKHDDTKADKSTLKDDIEDIIESTKANIFSFENGNNNISVLSKNSPETDYVNSTSPSNGYKDAANGYYVCNGGTYNFGITNAMPLKPETGSYLLSAEVYIPSGNTERTEVSFGVCCYPENAFGEYNFKSVFSLNCQDQWVKIEKVVSVKDEHDAVYVSFASYIDTYPFYLRNIQFTPILGRWVGKRWVVVGDSITEKNGKTLKNYHDYIAENTGIEVVNMGVSGTGYKNYEDTNNAFYQRIINVPTNADVVTIFGSGNDLGGSYTLGDATDTGTDTLCGCINTTIDNLYSVLPTVQLGIITPNPWGGFNPSDENNLMAQYSAKIVEICRLRGIPCLDLYHCSGLRPWDNAFLELAYPMNTEGSARDRVHPNEIGHSIMAPRIKAFLESLIM